jgi:DNA-binding HxlR family transcriptional regulator
LWGGRPGARRQILHEHLIAASGRHETGGRTGKQALGPRPCTAMKTRIYGQTCPIACALDVLGERWTLLILRELLGGPRRYADLRQALPGIATNLLSQRLRQLVAEGIIEQFDVPPPVSRTMYRLSGIGWRHVPPVIGALAAFGSDRLPRSPEDASPLTGFLVGIMLGFDSQRAASVEEDYRVIVDGRVFEIGICRGSLCGARGAPAAELHASASDLVRLRRDPTASSHAPVELHGPKPATARFTSAFRLDLSSNSVPG